MADLPPLAFVVALVVAGTSVVCATAPPPPSPITNARVLIDMVQNNPGDAVAWEQTKYADARVLKKLDYTAQCTTGEVSGTQAVDFHTLGAGDFFPAGSPQRQWLDAYAAGVDRFVARAVQAGLKAYFFVDMVVFPTPVLEAFPNATNGHGKVVWNEVTQHLLRVLVDETFARFPNCSGFVVRTGETYTYDTPFHRGNSPSNGTQDLWVSFISFLRDQVCEQHGKDLFFRGWDNWPSDAGYYQAMTDRIPTHPQLYFSIKHSAGDFTRPAEWNNQLGVGKHAQIVEVELQREYEGKGAYPNYVLQGVIDGFPEMKTKIGLSNIIHAPQLKGLWTWTRGGGWWGPYIHGNEMWIDLHAETLSRWWTANGSLTEEAANLQAIQALFAGCTDDCAAAMRSMVIDGSNAVLYGQWCTVGSGCGLWMRDDRIGGLGNGVSRHFSSLKDDASLWNATLANRAKAMTIFQQMFVSWQSGIKGHLTDPVQADKIEASVMYGVHLYSVIDAAWRVMVQGYRKTHNLSYNATELLQAIADYDARMMAYQAYGLSELYAPSLYHPYYLCLGTQCNCGVSPPAGQAPDGIGATVDSFRSTTEPCGTFKGFECHATAYCSNHPGTSPMTNYSYTGPDSLEGCEARCSADPNCSCFVHKLPPSVRVQNSRRELLSFQPLRATGFYVRKPHTCSCCCPCRLEMLRNTLLRFIVGPAARLWACRSTPWSSSQACFASRNRPGA
eukprot:m.232290 g.232290  ORF g.232290 m.232290 type:complete len:727 (+) comp18882_c0_seq12:64-2244(+)